jgi:hypothetical protein
LLFGVFLFLPTLITAKRKRGKYNRTEKTESHTPFQIRMGVVHPNPSFADNTSTSTKKERTLLNVF